MKNRHIGAGLGSLALVLSMMGAGPADAGHRHHPKGKVVLFSVGSKFAGSEFAVKGSFSTNTSGTNKRVVLQIQRASGTWRKLAEKRHLQDGTFLFQHLVVKTAQTTHLRAKLYKGLHRLDVSNTPRLRLIQPLPSDNLPNLVVRNLNMCSQAEQDKSQVGCFRVEPFTKADTSVVQLLKFPATTFNIGAGAMEVRSHRDNPQDGTTLWHDTLSVQRVYNDKGSFRDVDITPLIDFYWEELPNGANDSHGHTHWHITDFDHYTVDGSNDQQEKHGFCISSSQTNGPKLPDAGTLNPAYDDTSACGFQQPNATDIVHGLSPLYGDTYPSSLDDQGVDVTNIADGTHTIMVCTDQHNVLVESDETDNCASADVTIATDATTGARSVTAVTNATGYAG